MVLKLQEVVALAEDIVELHGHGGGLIQLAVYDQLWDNPGNAGA